MADRDYYEVLEVPRRASQEEIKRSYRKLARRYHPDVNPGDKSSEQKFKEIQEAYDVLGDAENRKKYDQLGKAAFATGAAGAGPRARTYTWRGRAGPAGESSGFDFGGFDFSSVFAEDFGLGGGYPGTATRDRGLRAGQDIEQEVQIPFMIAAKGGEIQLTIRRRRACPKCQGSRAEPGSRMVNCTACGGSGQRRVPGPIDLGLPCDVCGGEGRVPERLCSQCGGTGTIETTEKISVRIPAGVDDGSRIRLKGQGEAGPGGRAGDLYIVPRVQPHPYFQRDGRDIIVEVPLTVDEAALGTRIDVPTLDGPVTLTIPPGTSSGQRLRMRSRGIAKPGGTRGDQFVETRIVLPARLDEESRELLKRFAEQNRFDPRASLGW
jgi:molecular chaperone DnaJ